MEAQYKVQWKIMGRWCSVNPGPMSKEKAESTVAASPSMELLAVPINTPEHTTK